MKTPEEMKQQRERTIAEKEPWFFEWVDNSVEEALTKLQKAERELDGRLRIGEVISEFGDSNLFHKLYSRYTDAHAACQGDAALEQMALDALLARIYIAGSFRRCPVVDNFS